MSAGDRWEPTDRYWQGSRLQQVMQRLGTGSYEDFGRVSVEEPERFWAATLADLGIEWFSPYERLVDLDDGVAWPRWFPGGTTNISHNAVTRWCRAGQGARTAVIAVDEDGTTRTRTFAELERDHAAVAADLRDRGVGRGDRVLLQLPFGYPAAVALLAVARIGAVAVPVFTGFGAQSIADRIRDSGATIALAARGFQRRGKVVDLLGPLTEAVRRVGGLPVVTIGHSAADDIDLTNTAAPGPDAAAMTGADPLLVAYTSGTTGRPKGAVHTHTGLPLKVAQELAQLMGVGPGSVVLRVTDMGWVGGSYTILSALTAGAAIVMYSGLPTFPDASRLWALVEQFGVTHLGVSPTYARMLRRLTDRPTAGHDIDSLLMTSTTGEAWDPETHDWYMRSIGNRALPIINHSGGTEVGNLLGCVPVRPIEGCAFNTTIPGVDVAVLDADGHAVSGAPGELVVRRPFVGMTQGLWNDPDRYLATYWTRFPGIWSQGDRAVSDSPTAWRLLGRSDDRIKVSGRSVMPDDVEQVVVADRRIAGAALFGIPDDMTGSALVLLVEPADAAADTAADADATAVPALVDEVRAVIRAELGASLLPKHLHVVAQLPRTESGKIQRAAIRAAYLGTGPDGPRLPAFDAIRALAAELQGA